MGTGDASTASRMGTGVSPAERLATRNANVGAGLALLSEVSSAVIPLSVEAYARDIAAAARAAADDHREFSLSTAMDETPWFPNLRVDPHNAYVTSAVLASAVDTATLCYRRNRSYTHVPVAAGSTRKANAAAASADIRMSAKGRTQLRARGSGVASGAGRGDGVDFDSAPRLAFATGLSVADLVKHVVPAPSYKMVTLRAALPFAHPHSTPDQLHRLLGASPSLHDPALGPEFVAPLSWHCALPRGVKALAPGVMGPRAQRTEMATNREALYASAGRAAPKPITPFAHVLAARGLRGAGAAPAGVAFDQYLARTPCFAARHCVVDTPLPIPLSFPNIVSPVFDRWGGAGATVGKADAAAGTRAWPGDSRGWGASGLPPPSSRGSRNAKRSHDGDAVKVPDSLSVVAHLSNTPAFRPALQQASSWWRELPTALRRRFADAGLDDDAAAVVGDTLNALSDSYDDTEGADD